MSSPAPHSSSAEAVFDRAAATYGRIGRQFYDQAGHVLVQLVLPQPGEALLDVGCGRGASLMPAAAAVTHRGRAVGIDKSPPMVSAANQALADRGLTHAFAAVADATVLPFPAQTFDVLLAGLVLHFLPRPQDSLRQFTHVLRPGGRIAICTPAPAPDGLDIVDRTANASLAEFVGNQTGRRTGAPRISSSHIIEELNRLRYRQIQEMNMFFPISLTVPQYWEWRMSHGGREFMERIVKRDRSRAREKLLESIRSVSIAGRVHLPMPVCMIVASSRPGRGRRPPV